MSANPNVKFRPVLSLAQISYISNLCAASLSDSPLDLIIDKDMSASIRKVMVPMIAKIDVGALVPAYSISPQMEAQRLANEEHRRYDNDLMTPEESAAYEAKLLGM